MPRIRTIKPEFWDSPGTARASLRARLFFIALWNWADDYGIGTANPRQLLSFAFPNDADVTDAEFPCLRTEVADCYGVTWYEVDGRPYFAIPSWDRHQKNERRAGRRNPGPDEAESPSDKGEHPSGGTSAQMHGTSVRTHGKSPLGTGEQGNRGTGEVTPSPDGEDDPNPGFDDFWAAWPRKVDKGHARTAWRTAAKKADPSVIVAAAAAFAAKCKAERTEPKFICHAATWLRGERWTDQETDARPDPVADGMWEGAY